MNTYAPHTNTQMIHQMSIRSTESHTISQRHPPFSYSELMNQKHRLFYTFLSQPSVQNFPSIDTGAYASLAGKWKPDAALKKLKINELGNYVARQ